MVENPSQAERLAALLAAVPDVFLGTDLPERPARSSGGMYARPWRQPAHSGATKGLCEGVKIGKARLQKRCNGLRWWRKSEGCS